MISSRQRFIRNVLLSFLVLWSSLASSSAGAAGFTAKAFEINRPDQLLFTLDRNTGADGLSSSTTFSSPEGKLLATEKMEYDASGNPLKYTVDHLQAGTSGTVEVKDGKLAFTYRNASGKVKTATEDLPAIWATGPMMIPLLRKHWDSILKGETLKFRLAAWERCDTVGFEISKERVERTADGQERVVLKLKASNFIIAAIVSPMYFQLASDGSFMWAMTGRALPKRQVGDSFKDLDANLVYTPKP